MTTEEPDLTGIVLDDRYRLQQRLGMGGMGSVYAAEHIRIAKSVAVKVLNREFAYKESFRRRFLREAQAASLIGHKNVVDIHDFGHDDSVVYIVMDLLEGQDLHHVIHERAPLPWSEARGLLLQMAAALGAAHSSGVIHRDVKPANVFIVDDPADGPLVKVLDFGIARATRINMTEPAPSNATASSRVFGTPTYMAPELAFGDVADARSDLYSLGVVAYRMLTSLLPFEGDVPFLVISRHANEPPVPLRSIEPSVPRGVELVVLKALAKRPRDRFQSMSSFARALEAIDEDGQGDVPAELLTETEDAPVEPVAPRPRRRRSAATPAEAKPRAKSGPHSPTRRLAEHLDGEASDVNAEITDLGTERLPSKRRRDGSEISAVTDIGRTGFTERVVTEPSPSVAEDPAADDPVFARDSTSDDGAFAVASLRAADSGTGPSRRGWVLQAIGLAALVAVAAAVGALMARPSGGAAVAKQAPVAVPPPAQPARLADVGALAAGEPSAVQAPASDGSSGGGSTTGGVEATSTDGAGGSTAGSDSGSDGGSETGAAAVVNIPTTPPPPRRGAPTPRRKKTDAAVKKKLRREIQRHCVDEVSGYRTKIEGFIGEGGRVTGVRIIDGPSAARGCIKGLVEARRFPPGELRNLDLTVTL